MKKYSILLFFLSYQPLQATLTLTSPAFKHNGIIPDKYTCEGDNVSPELKWMGAPNNTKSFALLVEDPDAPSKVFVHWMLFNIPATVNHLPENSITGQFTNGATDFNKAETYGGPCPPVGKRHRYNFTLYALDIMPNEFPRAMPDTLRSGADRAHLMEIMHDHILESTTLTGYYEKK